MTDKGTSHKKTLHRVNRIEGQVRGIGRMIEDEKYCVEIIRQIRSIRSALSSLEMKIIEEHLSHCVTDALESGNAEKKMGEILTLFKEANK